MMKELQEWTQLGDLCPTQKMVTLAKDGFQVPVVCFNFPAMICSLFNDREVNQLKNLVINPDDPFGKYVSPDGKLNDVNSAQIYELAYDHCCTSEKDFLALVILYMDKTVISQTKEGLSALPVMMTVATFNCEVNILIGVPYLLHSHLLSNNFILLALFSSIQTRNKSLAWRPLGFIPNVDNFYSKAHSFHNRGQNLALSADVVAVAQPSSILIALAQPASILVAVAAQPNDVNSAKIYEVANDHCCTSDKDW